MVPLFSIPKVVRAYGEQDTCNKLWNYAVHFLNAAFLEKHPATDPEGNTWEDKACLKVAGNELCGGL
eukprot:12394443-Alexandrium_andersonii.AAC.1